MQAVRLMLVLMLLAGLVRRAGASGVESLPWVEAGTPATNAAEALALEGPWVPTPDPALCTNAASQAAEASPSLSGPAWPDRWQGSVSRWVLRSGDQIDWQLEQWFAFDENEGSRSFDRYFGDRSLAENERSGSRVRLSTEVGIQEYEGATVSARYSARLHLPRMEHRAELIVDNLQSDEDVLQGLDDALTRADRIETDDERSARLRVTLLEHLRSRLSLDAGLRFSPEPVPKLALNFDIRRQAGPWRLHVREGVFWRSDDGFGAVSRLNLKRRLGERWMTGLANAAVLSESYEGVNFGHTLQLVRNTSKRSSAGIAASVAWYTQPERGVENYALRLPLRRGLYREWIDLLLEPGLNFPEDDDYRMVPLVTLRLDFHFGDLR